MNDRPEGNISTKRVASASESQQVVEKMSSIQRRTSDLKSRLGGIIERLEGPKPPDAVGAIGEPTVMPSGFFPAIQDMQETTHRDLNTIDDYLGKIEGMLSGEF